MTRGKKETSRERLLKYSTDSGARKQLCADLCRHLEQGYSMESFSKVSTRILRTYLKDYKEDFDPEDIEQAMQTGRQGWEQIGRRQADGQCLGNSRSWYLNMSNRYGWTDKQHIEVDGKQAVSVNIVSYASSKPSGKCVGGDNT